ncbi:hypothetical protein GCM10010317_049990 [Streptomyces mirabilis]|nr:hypothetical protein GCM10010317_049990 [Streptomyces mirabilis]
MHEPLALRCVLRLVLEDGTVGLGETPGGDDRLECLLAAGKVIVGMDVFDTTAVAAAIDATLLPTVPGSHERGWITSAVEVACLDAQGRLTGRPVSDLLGGRVRDSVPFAAYLFYKWAEHPALDGRPAIGDGWGEALGPRRGPPRQPAPPGPQHGLDRRDLAVRGTRTGGSGRVLGGPHAHPRRYGRGRRDLTHAAGHQHVRDRLGTPAPGRGTERDPGPPTDHH